jgi:REP element-mobilizing transposase RayT
MNKYNPDIHHRRSIRLKGYDYSQAGLYFVTICVQNRECLFGDVIVGADQRVCPCSTAQNGQAFSQGQQEGENGDGGNGQDGGNGEKWGNGQNWGNGQTHGSAPTGGVPTGVVPVPTLILNDAGEMIEKWYYKLESKFPDIKCNEMVVMPNHFHCIIENTGVMDGHVGGNITGEHAGNIMGEHAGSPLLGLYNGSKQ